VTFVIGEYTTWLLSYAKFSPHQSKGSKYRSLQISKFVKFSVFASHGRPCTHCVLQTASHLIFLSQLWQTKTDLQHPFSHRLPRKLSIYNSTCDRDFQHTLITLLRYFVKFENSRNNLFYTILAKLNKVWNMRATNFTGMIYWVSTKYVM